MGGFPIKHFFKGGKSIVPHSDGQMLRRVEDGVGAGGMVREHAKAPASAFGVEEPLYGRGLHTADLEFRKHTWLSRRLAKVRDYFNLEPHAKLVHTEMTPRSGTQLAAVDSQVAVNQAIRAKIRALQNQVEAEAEQRIPPFQVMPGIVVTHSLPASR